MIRLSALGLFFLVLGAPFAEAGAWLRETGHGFLSASGTLNDENDLAGTLYGEFGLSDRLTLGIELNGGMDREAIPSGDGTIFLRFPLSAPEASTKWAAHVGVGARYEPQEFSPSVELGLSWGRGFQWGERYGWATVDATMNLAQSPMRTINKVDATVGLGISPTIKVVAQIFYTQTADKQYTTLAPSVLLTPENSPTTFQIGAEFPQEDDEGARLKLGIWLEF